MKDPFDNLVTAKKPTPRSLIVKRWLAVAVAVSTLSFLYIIG